MEPPRHVVEVVCRAPSRRLCNEQALVLRAAGIGHSILPDVDGFKVIVQSRDAEKALAELAAYARENVSTAQSDETVGSIRTDGWAGVFCYAIVILLVAVFRDRELFGFDWHAAGRTSAKLICEGQWWRTITALTLHADEGHLAANLVVGGLFGLFAAQLLGTGLAWFSILLGGAAGNAINAAVRLPGHTSVGASTAIFAALGIVAACSWTQRRAGPWFSLRRWTPLIGGVVLLSFLGVSEAPTDVPAHVFGFLAGVVIGLVLGKLCVGSRIVATVQTLLTIGTFALLSLAWVLALTAGN